MKKLMDILGVVGLMLMMIGAMAMDNESLIIPAMFFGVGIALLVVSEKYFERTGGK